MDTRQLLLDMLPRHLGMFLRHLDTFLLDPDTLLPTPVLPVLHQLASLENLLRSLQLLLHSLQLLMVHHINTEVTLLLSSQEHLVDIVTAAAGGRDPSAYFENVECMTPNLSYYACKVNQIGRAHV